MSCDRKGATTTGVPYGILRGSTFTDGSTALAAGPVRSYFACLDCRAEFASKAAFEAHKEARGHMKSTQASSAGPATEVRPSLVRRAAGAQSAAVGSRDHARVTPAGARAPAPPVADGPHLGKADSTNKPAPAAGAKSTGLSVVETGAVDSASGAGRAPSVPANLLLTRRARAMSRTRLAERVGVTAQAIALFENGWVDLWPDDKAEIARVLQVPGAVLRGPSTDVLLAWLEREDISRSEP